MVQQYKLFLCLNLPSKCTYDAATCHFISVYLVLFSVSTIREKPGKPVIFRELGSSGKCKGKTEFSPWLLWTVEIGTYSGYDKASGIPEGSKFHQLHLCNLLVLWPSLVIIFCVPIYRFVASWCSLVWNICAKTNELKQSSRDLPLSVNQPVPTSHQRFHNPQQVLPLWFSCFCHFLTYKSSVLAMNDEFVITKA